MKSRLLTHSGDPMPGKLNFLFLFILIAGSLYGCAGWDPEGRARLEQDAAAAIATFRKKDPSMRRFFDNAYAYAVFPTVGKGAVTIGGAYGNGLVYRRGRIIGRTSLTQVTIGLQLGGQAYSEIIFFRDRKVFDNFRSGNLKLSAQLSAVAATAGASANAAYENGVAVFTLTKGGLMYEASVGGQSFSYEPVK